MTFDRPPVIEQDDDGGAPSSILFNNDMLRWQSPQQNIMDYHHQPPPSISSTTTHHQIMPSSSSSMNMDLAQPSPLQAVVPSPITTNQQAATAPALTTPLPAINTTNPALAPPPPVLDPTKQYHPEWGVIKDQDFHGLTLKHQRDLENLYQTGSAIADFYFWQANLGGYCMADMVQGIVVSSEGAFVLERKIVEGAPHPGRRKKKRGLG